MNVAAVRALLSGRKEKCHPECPGFCPGLGGIEKCDECAGLNGYRQMTDADVRRLPEARKLAARVEVK